MGNFGILGISIFMAFSASVAMAGPSDFELITVPVDGSPCSKACLPGVCRYQGGVEQCVLKTSTDPQANSNTNTNANTEQNTGGNTSATMTTADCLSQMSQLVDKCTTQEDSTSHSCNDSEDPTMNSTLNTLQQAAVVLGQQTASSVTAACSKMAGLSEAANAAVAAYQANCSAAINSCNSACASAVSFWNKQKGCAEQVSATMVGPPQVPPTTLYDRAKDSMKACQGFNAKAQQAQQAVQNYAMTAANAAHCADSTSGTPTPQLCQQNPNLEGCSAINMDCSNAAMASNKVCICSKNPNDPTCLATQSASVNSQSNGTDMASKVSTTSGGDIGDLGATPDIAQGKLPTDGADAPIDGKQGAGVSFGNSTGNDVAAATKKVAADGKEAANGSSVNSGFYGGGSGGSFGSYGSDSSGSSSNFMQRMGSALKKGTSDLRQFLPGGQLDPRRGLAGASGPDGITGPNSNIWEKIQNRYQVVRPTLIP